MTGRQALQLPPNYRSARRVTERQAVLRTAGPSHVLVKFHLDDCLCVVPKKHLIDAAKLCNNQECEVKWNGELLTATVVAMGDKGTMDKMEQEILSGLREEDETCDKPPPSKKAKKDTTVDKENKKCTPKNKGQVGRKPLTQVQKVCVCVCMCVCVCVYVCGSLLIVSLYSVE